MPAPTAPVALLLVDVINTFDFAGGETLLEQARPVAPRLAALAERARAAGVPVIYANDNFAAWSDPFDRLIERCTEDDAPCAPFVRQVRPQPDDLFLLKPKHSAFYQTALDTLLRQMGTHTVVLAGLATDICVLASAIDAAARDLHLVVPQDASAAETERAHRAAMVHFRRVLHAETPPATGVDVEALAEAAPVSSPASR